VKLLFAILALLLVSTSARAQEQELEQTELGPQLRNVVAPFSVFGALFGGFGPVALGPRSTANFSFFGAGARTVGPPLDGGCPLGCRRQTD
jgi:hypothetical protein